MAKRRAKDPDERYWLKCATHEAASGKLELLLHAQPPVVLSLAETTLRAAGRVRIHREVAGRLIELMVSVEADLPEVTVSCDERGNPLSSKDHVRLVERGLA